MQVKLQCFLSKQSLSFFSFSFSLPNTLSFFPLHFKLTHMFFFTSIKMGKNVAKKRGCVKRTVNREEYTRFWCFPKKHQMMKTRTTE